MKKVLSLVLCVILVSSLLVACRGGKNGKIEIPDVFGINYTDAIEILEAEGFEVKAIESSVGSFSDKLLYPLEKVDKGTVFKIDEYIIDNNGNLNKNYDVFYDEGLVSNDKSLVIYYAKEDYVLENNESSNNATPSTKPATEPSTKATSLATEPSTKATSPATEPSTKATSPATEPSTKATLPAATEEQKDSTSIDPNFKAAMDSYEKFFDEYVAIMKKYKENPTDLSILSDYATYMGQYADMMQKLEKWGNEDLNTAETAYYIDVQARITKKLLEVA